MTVPSLTNLLTEQKDLCQDFLKPKQALHIFFYCFICHLLLDSEQRIIVGFPWLACSRSEAASPPQAGQFMIHSHHCNTSTRVRFTDYFTPVWIIHRFGSTVGDRVRKNMLHLRLIGLCFWTMQILNRLTDRSILLQKAPCRHTGNSHWLSSSLLSHTLLPCVHSSLKI